MVATDGDEEGGNGKGTLNLHLFRPRGKAQAGQERKAQVVAFDDNIRIRLEGPNGDPAGGGLVIIEAGPDSWGVHVHASYGGEHLGTARIYHDGSVRLVSPYPVEPAPNTWSKRCPHCAEIRAAKKS